MKWTDEEVDERYAKTVRFNKYHAMSLLLMEIANTENRWKQRAADILAGRFTADGRAEHE